VTCGPQVFLEKIPARAQGVRLLAGMKCSKVLSSVFLAAAIGWCGFRISEPAAVDQLTSPVPAALTVTAETPEAQPMSTVPGFEASALIAAVQQ